MMHLLFDKNRQRSHRKHSENLVSQSACFYLRVVVEAVDVVVVAAALDSVVEVNIDEESVILSHINIYFCLLS